ncbi:MAG: class I SAM-dependent methyltransferase [Bacteroidetes bacterium]|nr:class I SAM-dependent methyltransferase [Bacteroidota bacterium]MBS1540280.1 class I SAM-dependent methyltransferase [Bacteroidota bacterium]
MPLDRFSGHAHQYATFRPTYPTALYEFIYSLIKNFDNAWDAGTGNGQVASVLGKKFKKVEATDISEKQLKYAAVADNIAYSLAGETTPFSAAHFDLITVAQAIHWFDREKFFQEVRRVGKPGAVVAVWGYGLLSINEAIDPIIKNFYVNVIGPYWDKERKLVDEAYKTISFPFQEIPCPPFSFSFEWAPEELHGYLTTWSSVQKFMKEKNSNPVDGLMAAVRQNWKSGKMKINFPLFTRIGLID